MKSYNVMLNGEIVGSVCETCEGLYTIFQCQCQLPDTQIYRLHMFCGDQETDLGVCVPVGTQYAVNKMIPSKQIANGEKVFMIIPMSQDHCKRFVPVSSDAPFAYISMLDRARLCYDNAQYGIVFDDQPRSK